jgi:hypothetical protein
MGYRVLSVGSLCIRTNVRSTDSLECIESLLSRPEPCLIATVVGSAQFQQLVLVRPIHS